MINKKQRSGAAKLIKLLPPFILMIGLTLFFLSNGYEYFSFSLFAENYSSLKAFVVGQKVTALLVFGATYILTVALSLPIATLLTLAGGALLGWTGAAVIICAATIGATIVFILARSTLNEFLSKRATKLLVELEAGFQKNAFYYLLALRLIPAAPFWVVNILPALLGMRLNHYMLATFIGITPGTLIYVWFARSFDNLLLRGQSPDLSVFRDPSIIAPLFALGLFSLIPAVWKWLRARRHISALNNTQDDAQNETINA